MCVRNVRVDEARLRKISSTFNDSNVIDRWLQLIVDNAVDDLELPHNFSPNAHSAEDMRNLLVERVRRAEEGEERRVPNEVVFGSIRSKYSF